MSFPIFIRQFRARALLLVALGSACVSVEAAQQYNRKNNLFLYTADGSNRYHSFLQPSLVKGSGNVLIAFCEGRKGSVYDWESSKDLVYKRSTNNGDSWGSLVVLQTALEGESYMNPTTVFEPSWDASHPNGRIHLLFNFRRAGLTEATMVAGDTQVYYMFSDDNGVTWQTNPASDGIPGKDITRFVHANLGLPFDLVGPGAGIRRVQSGAGTHVGDLVVPALSRNFISRDHGANWTAVRCPLATGVVNNWDLSTNEPTITELLSGELLRNDRAKGRVVDGIEDTDKNGNGKLDADTNEIDNNRRRWLSKGKPETSFEQFAPKASLLDPRMTGSSLRYNFNVPDRIIFINSASTVNDWDDTDNSKQQKGRGRMKVYISYDDGNTWDTQWSSRWLYSGTVPESGTTYADVDAAQLAGRGGGSAMAKLTHNTYGIGALVVVNNNGYNASGHRAIDLHRFNIEWIVSGHAEPQN